jgi:hypothetical protein
MTSGLYMALQLQQSRRSDTARRNTLVIYQVLISGLPAGARARIDAAHRKYATSRTHPIPSCAMRVVSPAGRMILITLYPTTAVSDQSPVIKCQLQLAHVDDRDVAVRYMLLLAFAGMHVRPEQIALEVTNVHRPVYLRPGAAINLDIMRNTNVPVGMGVSEHVEGRTELSGMRYRRVQVTAGDRVRKIAVNFTAEAVMLLGARGTEVADTVSFAVCSLLLRTPSAIVLFCNEAGVYDPDARGKTPVIWRPGVAGRAQLQLADVFRTGELPLASTPEREAYLAAMLRGETTPPPRVRRGHAALGRSVGRRGVATKTV